MKKKLLNTLKVFALIYIAVCCLLFFFQEKLIFFPQKLDKEYQFRFTQHHEEINIKTVDGKLLNAILFKSDSSKGVIFYLHGNAGSLATWGEIATAYTRLHYDVFMIDYRGYGKSEGTINSQEQIYADLQLAYNEIKQRYTEDKIIVIGYSIGSGLAAKIASANKPSRLILQAPYYSLTDMMRHNYPIIPTFLLRYKFETDKFIKDCSMPIVLFHGIDDKVIYYNSSVKLKALLKPNDTLITLHGWGHNNMTWNKQYCDALKGILQ
ncbi:MAG: alpha/beta fold hydrolase [Bacteroidetes bacterium]|nr:alpha/beta fold hydrolase [Bacteroidota bacterium]